MIDVNFIMCRGEGGRKWDRKMGGLKQVVSGRVGEVQIDSDGGLIYSIGNIRTYQVRAAAQQQAATLLASMSPEHRKIAIVPLVEPSNRTSVYDSKYSRWIDGKRHEVCTR